MRGAAGAEDEDALLPQWRQRLAEVVVVRAVAVGLHRQLAHGDVGVRVHEHQRHPGAVVQPAAVVLLHGAEPGLLQELLGPQGQVRSARSGVLELEGDKGVYSFRISEQTSDFRAIQFKHDAEKTE